MKRIFTRAGWAALLLLAALTVVATGCSTTESDNVSSRPWDSPRGWETGGLPSSMNEGR